MGVIAGILIAVLTVLAEHSRIAIGGYALYGNGALIIPAILAPFALYPGWTWVLRRGGRALELALFAVELHFGVGAIALLEVVFFPQSPDLTMLDALPGLLLTGAVFVDPAALLAAGTLWAVRRTKDPSLPIALGGAFVVAILLGFLYGIGLGVLAGAAVALAERKPPFVFAIGLGLALVVLVLGNVPYVPAMLGG